MKNKVLAIFGIATYLLSVYTSRTNLQGEPKTAEFLIITSGILSILFTVFATIQLWKFSKRTALLLSLTTLILFVIELIPYTPLSINLAESGLLINGIKIVNRISYFFSIFLLFGEGRYSTTTSNSE